MGPRITTNVVRGVCWDEASVAMGLGTRAPGTDNAKTRGASCPPTVVQICLKTIDGMSLRSVLDWNTELTDGRPLSAHQPGGRHIFGDAIERRPSLQNAGSAVGLNGMSS